MLTHYDAWNFVRSRAAPVPWASFLWKNKVNPQISCLIWRLIHKKMPTHTLAWSISVNLASRCALCGVEEESEGHLFFICDFSSSLWRWLLSSVGGNPLMHLLASSIWIAISRGGNAIESQWAASFFSFSFSISLLSYGIGGMWLPSTTKQLQYKELGDACLKISPSQSSLCRVIFRDSLKIFSSNFWEF
eukprot:TRINITY_DN10534_c0_g5_i1.p1 TRINITY_DN10534_c0_g5~~TRINITY_DN10534_c0_g5_i1.p1  ORF type:complete len:190 (-),score=20.97 TRINITY_DN10534_c0_g5_i1:766-1335(-)